MKNRIFLINIFWFAFNCSFASDIYENNDNGIPSFSNTPTKNSKKINLGKVNVINEPSTPSKITINNNLNISNQTSNNSPLENSYYSGECSQYYNDYYSSYSYTPYMCEYFFRRHDDHRLDNTTKRDWYNIDRETNHFQQHINFNRSMPIASPMGMGMRMGGGRR